MSVEVACGVEGVEEFKAAMERFDRGILVHVQWRLKNWAADVKALAKQLVPVRTGQLQSSIYARVQEWVVEIGAEAAYALFVEFGTRHVQARPYLYPAITECLPQLERVILEALDNAKAEAGME